MQAGTARLHRIDLGLRPRQSLEARGELRSVEEESLAGLDGAEGSSGCAADVATHYAGVLVRLVQGAMLLGFLAVAGEGLGERVRRGCWVRVRGVVDLCGESVSGFGVWR